MSDLPTAPLRRVGAHRDVSCVDGLDAIELMLDVELTNRTAAKGHPETSGITLRPSARKRRDRGADLCGYLRTVK